MKINIIDWDNKKTGDIELSDGIFKLPIRIDILQRVVEWQRARKQTGNHKVKERPEVSGTTKKPFKQKGTGNARQGTLRGPHQRGGCRVHGPRVRSHAYSLNKKFRKLGLKTALSAKAAEGKLHIIKDAKLSNPKTKDFIKTLEKLGLKSALFIDTQIEENFGKAVNNVMHVDALPIVGANVYDILKHEYLVLTEQAVKQFEERLA